MNSVWVLTIDAREPGSNDDDGDPCQVLGAYESQEAAVSAAVDYMRRELLGEGTIKDVPMSNRAILGKYLSDGGSYLRITRCAPGAPAVVIAITDPEPPKDVYLVMDEEYGDP